MLRETWPKAWWAGVVTQQQCKRNTKMLLRWRHNMSWMAGLCNCHLGIHEMTTDEQGGFSAFIDDMLDSREKQVIVFCGSKMVVDLWLLILLFLANHHLQTLCEYPRFTPFFYYPNHDNDDIYKTTYESNRQVDSDAGHTHAYPRTAKSQTSAVPHLTPYARPRRAQHLTTVTETPCATFGQHPTKAAKSIKLCHHVLRLFNPSAGDCWLR